MRVVAPSWTIPQPTPIQRVTVFEGTSGDGIEFVSLFQPQTKEHVSRSERRRKTPGCYVVLVPDQEFIAYGGGGGTGHGTLLNAQLIRAWERANCNVFTLLCNQWRDHAYIYMQPLKLTPLRTIPSTRHSVFKHTYPHAIVELVEYRDHLRNRIAQARPTERRGRWSRTPCVGR